MHDSVGETKRLTNCRERKNERVCVCTGGGVRLEDYYLGQIISLPCEYFFLRGVMWMVYNCLPQLLKNPLD